MIYDTEARVQQVSAHHVGNPNMEGELFLSEHPLSIADERLEELLLRYFFSSFKEPEFHSFTFEDGNLEFNTLYSYVSEIFANPENLHEQSVKMAQHLFDITQHPNIKSGDLYVAYLTDIQLDGAVTDAIGIFKSEIKDSILKLDTSGERFQLDYDSGTSVSKLDKGCLVFNVEKEEGYKLCFVDKVSKGAEAKYWRDEFLQVKPCSDDFNQTKGFLGMTKKFVTKELNKEFDVDKTDQAALLNRSMEYFKTHQQFEEDKFEEEVLGDQKVITAFQDYKNDFKEKQDYPIANNFPISELAVKKQNSVFKSVLKLDKNFHIYIHGDKDLIERGTDDSGRKYYKIFYNEER